MIDDPLKSRNQDLSSFSQRVDLYIKNKNHIIDVLQEENDRLRNQLASASGHVPAPAAPPPETPVQEEENKKLRGQIERLQESLQLQEEFQSREEEYRQRISLMETRNAELQRQLTQLQNQPVAPPVALPSVSAEQEAEWKRRLQALEEGLADAERQRKELTAEKQRLEKEVAELNDRDPVPPEVVRELQELVRDNSNLRHSLSQAETVAREHALDAAQVATLRQSLAQAEATAREHAIDATQTATLRQAQATLAAQLQEERDRGSALEAQLQTAVTRAQEMAKAAALAASMVGTNTPGEPSGPGPEEANALRRQSREWREQLEAAQQRVRVLEEEDRQLKQKLEDQRIRIEALESDFDHQKTTIGSAVGQFEALQAENQTLRERLASQSQGATRLQDDLKRQQHAAASNREESELLHQTILRLEESLHDRSDEIKTLRNECENWRTAHELALREIEDVKKATLPAYEAKHRLDAALERERSMMSKLENLQQQKLLLEGQLSRVFFGTPPAVRRLMDSDTPSGFSDAIPDLPSMEVHLPFCFPDKLPLPLRVTWERLPARYQHKGREEGAPSFRVIRPVRFSRTFLHLALAAPSLINPSQKILSVMPFRTSRVQPVSTFSASLSREQSLNVPFGVLSPGVVPLPLVRRPEPEIYPAPGPRPRFRPVTYSFQMFLQSLEKGIVTKFRGGFGKLEARIPSAILARGPVTRGGLFRTIDSKRAVRLPLADGIRAPVRRLTLYRIPFEMQIPKDRINMLLKGIEQTLSALTSQLDQNNSASATPGATPNTKHS